MFGTYIIGRAFCSECKVVTDHENDSCLECKIRDARELKLKLGSEFNTKTIEQKVDYLFKKLVLKDDT